MNTLTQLELTEYIHASMDKIYTYQTEQLRNLDFKEVLKGQNPDVWLQYKPSDKVDDWVKELMNSYLFSKDENVFEKVLKGLAIFVNKKIYNGRKSGIPNIDLEFDKDNIRYIINIKSGPNWANSSQIKKMKHDFAIAKWTLRTSNSGIMVMAVNGCCYGKENRSDKGDYFKCCGQEFWEFISGNPDLYKEIIEPLGYKAKVKNEEFLSTYNRMLNKFTRDFTIDFCKENGEIDWGKFLEFNSGKN